MKNQNQNKTTSRHRRRTPIKSAFALFLALSLGGAFTNIRAAEADSLPGMGPQPVEYFYTGKPYDADTESYTFLYRNYDPEINRWTSVDPSGFPDGANNRIYAPTPTTEVDPFGLEVLNSVSDAIRWFNVGQGANATADLQIINGVKASGDYLAQITIGLEMSINMKLSAVEKTSNSGTISGTGYRGLYYGSVLGSFALHIDYESQWNASGWVNETRTVTSNVTLQLSINELYDFQPNASYSDFQNLTQEEIPGWIAEYSFPGQGTKYWIQACFTDTVNGTGIQNE